MFPPPPARSQYSVLIRARGRVEVGSRLRVGVGARVRLGFRDSAGVQSGQNFPLGGFGARGLLRVAPLASNCWPEAPWGGGGVPGPAESPPPPQGVYFAPKRGVFGTK